MKTSASNAVHTVILDWDGTLVPNVWPERPTKFMLGAVENLRRLHAANIRLVVFSARLSPWDPWTSMRRDPGHVATEIQYVRSMLDNAGLTFVDIWVKEGKPGGDVYVDDKAERYHGCKGCWDKVATKILMRLDKEPAQFPAFNQGASN